MRSFLTRFTSRKFILALVPMAAGLFMAFGVDGNELVDLVTAVVGLTTTLLGALGYGIVEAKVDAAKASADSEAVE